MIHLTADEGDALRVAELLVGHGRGLPPAVSISKPRAELLEATARTIAAGCMQLLLPGGVRERAVLREGRRATGRLWDHKLNDGLDLRFSAATRALWEGAVNELVPLAHKKKGGASDSTRDERRALRTVGAAPATAVGDHLFFALAHQHADALLLPSTLTEVWRASLRRASPLALLLAPDDPGLPRDGVRPALAGLRTPALLRCLECMDDLLVDAWLARLRAVATRTDLDELVVRLHALTSVLLGVLEVLDGAGRLDLARAVARFLAALPTRGLPQSVDLRARFSRLTGVTTIADRDRALEALAGVLRVAVRVDELRARLAQERYGDARFAEQQLVVPMLAHELDPHRAALDAVTRAVSGTVG